MMKAAALVLLLAQVVEALQGDSWRSSRLAFAPTQAKGLLHEGRAFGMDGRRSLLCPASTAAAGTSLRRPSAARAGNGGSLKMQMDPLTSYSIYELDNWVTREVVGQLQHITPFSGVVLLVAGVLTSLSPCSLSILPLTVGYIGGGGGDKQDAIIRSVAFAGGLALALSSLGLGAALAGTVFGILPQPWASVLPFLTSSLFVLLGLAQLEILPLPALLSPTVSASGTSSSASEIGKAAIFGATSALVSTPCGTPVLGAILALVAERQDPILGLFLLLCYSIGQAAPILAAGLSTSNLKGISKLQPTIAWVTPVSGSLLMVYGTYSIVERVSAMMG